MQVKFISLLLEEFIKQVDMKPASQPEGCSEKLKSHVLRMFPSDVTLRLDERPLA